MLDSAPGSTLRHVGVTLLVIATLSGCSPGAGDSVLVFGAASLTNVLQAQAGHYVAARDLPADAIRFHFHSSTVCATQIQKGAPADLFVSADDALVVGLARGGFVERNGYTRLVSNQLALIVPRAFPSSIRTVEDLAASGWRRFALGDPETVPAGKYGKQALESLHVWPAVAPRLLIAENVRLALLYVARGEADAGLVYVTDAASEPDVELVDVIGAEHSAPIIYSAAVIRGTRKGQATRAFLDFLAGSEAAVIWKRYGFAPLTSRGRIPGLPAGQDD